jgi:DNA polymerase (family 10)
MILSDAIPLSLELLDIFRPVCRRIEIAGSIRRKAKEVGDIEVVAQLDPAHLYDYARILSQYRVTKGGPKMKLVYFEYRFMSVNLFTADRDNWGAILTVRTGSAAFSRDVLAAGWVKAGYHSQDGHLRAANGERVPVREERDLFELIGVPWLEPEERNL